MITRDLNELERFFSFLFSCLKCHLVWRSHEWKWERMSQSVAVTSHEQTVLKIRFAHNNKQKRVDENETKYKTPKTNFSSYTFSISTPTPIITCDMWMCVNGKNESVSQLICHSCKAGIRQMTMMMMAIKGSFRKLLLKKKERKNTMWQ